MIARSVLTYDGMQGAPDDGLRRELLGGDLHVSPAPTLSHQDVVTALICILGAYADGHGGKVFPAPTDVVFSQIDAVQPDVAYVASDRLSILGANYIQGAPSLVIEVLSPSSTDIDLGRKLAMYAWYRVPEYWIVDPTGRTIVAHAEPSGDSYQRIARSVDATIEAITLPELRFTVP